MRSWRGKVRERERGQGVGQGGGFVVVGRMSYSFVANFFFDRQCDGTCI